MATYAVANMEGNASLYRKRHPEFTDTGDKGNRKNKRRKITSVEMENLDSSNMSKTSHNRVQIGCPSPIRTDEFYLSSTGRIEFECDIQSVSIGEINCQESQIFEVVHPHEEMQIPIEAITLENDHQIPSTSTLDINLTQTSSINHENFNQSPLQQFQNAHEICTCCHKDLFHRKSYRIFKRTNYNFDHAIVNRALFHTYHYCTPGRMEYICRICHNNLRSTGTKNAKECCCPVGQKGW